MEHKRIGPVREDEAGIVHASEQSPAYSTTAARHQRNAEHGYIPQMPDLSGSLDAYKRMLVDEGYFLKVDILDAHGPIEEIGHPLVLLGYHMNGTAVWVCQSRWTLQGRAPFRFVILPPGKDVAQSAIKWALDLRNALGRNAQREADRRLRLKQNYGRFGGGL